MKLLKHRRYLLLEVIILLFLSLTPFLWVGNGWVLVGHDSGFRFNIQHHLQNLWNTWNPSVNTGVDWSLYKGFLLIQFPEFVFQKLFGSLEVAQPFILCYWFFIIGIGMYGAMVFLFPERKNWFIRLYTSIFWMFNFYILQAWFIAERAKFSLYAALPLSIILLSLTIKKKIPLLIGAFSFGILYFFLNGGGSPPLFGASVLTWGITWVVFSYFSVRNNGKQGIIHSILTISLFCLIFFLFNAYWILPQVDLFRGTYTNAVSSEGGIDGLIAWEREISKYASILHLLQLQGLPDWYNNPTHPYSNPFITQPFLIFVSFLPIISIVVGGILFRKERSEHKPILLACLLLLCVGLFFASGSHPPTGNIYIILMRKIPGFAIFRSSFFKFAPVVWFSIIVLSGYYIQKIVQRITIKRAQVIGVIVLAGLLFYHYPFFSPTFFQFSPQFATRVKVPDYVKDVGIWFDTNNYIGRVLLLPELDRGFINKPIDTYTWGYYSLDALPRILSNHIFIANDSPYEVVQHLYNAFYNNERETVERLSAVLGITHVLFRQDVAHSSTSRLLDTSLLQQYYGSPVIKRGEWEVYETDSPGPKNITTTTYIPTIEPVKDESMFISTTTATFRTTWDIAQTLKQETIVFETECFYCAKDEYSSFISSIHMPHRSAFSRTEIPQITSIPRTPEGIDILLSGSMRTLVEYQQLYNTEKISEKQNIREEYINILTALGSIVEELEERNRIFYSARTHAFLLKQQDVVQQMQDVEVATVLRTIQTSLQEDIWVSDDSAYRYGIYIPIEGVFMLKSERTDLGNLKINEEGFKVNVPYTFKQGFYRIEVSKASSTSAPAIFFVLHTKQSEKIDNNMLFQFPFSFDSRWIISGAEAHGITNGYANGWILSPRTSEPNLTYAPQQTFMRGLGISLGSIIGCGLILFIKKRNI